jgi:predicted phosphodiesterase
MLLERLARFAAALTLLVGGFHVAARLSTQFGVEEGTLFARSAARLAKAHVPAAPVLLLIGDSGSASPELRANFAAMAREPALLALHAGDIGYRGPREYGRFLAAADALPFPIFAVPGDHDFDEARSYAAWDSRFGGRDQMIEQDGLRIVLLDTSLETVSEASFRFLDEALRRPPPPAAGPRWIIVVTHCPPYNPGAPGPKRLGEGHAIRDANAAARLLERLREAHATLLCAGHLHAFLRGDEAGVPLVVSGGGGKDVEPGNSFHYVRITLTDPPTIEPVNTTPATGRRPLERLADGVIAQSLKTGDRVTVVLAAVTTVLFAFARRSRASGW